MTDIEGRILESIETNKNKVRIFWDMDGTCTSMEMQNKEHKLEPGFFYTKRPIKTIINFMKKFNDLGADTFILSFCSYNYQKDDKLRWLKENCDFIKEENIIIIPRKEKSLNITEDKKYIKAHFIEKYTSPDDIIYMVDDNETVLLGTKEKLPYLNIVSPIDFIE